MVNAVSKKTHLYFLSDERWAYIDLTLPMRNALACSSLPFCSSSYHFYLVLQEKQIIKMDQNLTTTGQKLQFLREVCKQVFAYDPDSRIPHDVETQFAISWTMPA